MSNTLLGKTSKLLLGTAANAKRDFTGVASGTENIGASKSRDVRRVPGGRGVIASQSTPYVTNDFSIATDSNEVHDPVLRALNGQRVYFTWQPEGDSSGSQQFVGQGVATTVLTIDPATDSCTWAVTVEVDGEPVESTIS
ncbi:MAG: hypothetical protein OXQ29_18040 [Rhodospirillaceae bacterium]|nr:hypothetical protein [Rhodospirillaceae bacterium]